MLERLLDYWNSTSGRDFYELDRNTVSFARCMYKQFGLKNHQHADVAMSQLGKPVVYQWLAKNYNNIPSDPYNGRLRWIFFMGDMFEDLILRVTEQLDYEVEGSQTELKYDYQGRVNEQAGRCHALGHLDAIVRDPGTSEQAVIEVKTMSGYYAKQFHKEPNDDRGYLTQLSLYSECTGLPGYWLILNKETNRLSLVPLPEEKKDECLERARDAIKDLFDCTNLVDLYSRWLPPEPTEEIFKRNATGRLLIPQCVRYDYYSPYVYCTSQGTNGYNRPTVYVDSERQPADIEELLAPYKTRD